MNIFSPVTPTSSALAPPSHRIAMLSGEKVESCDRVGYHTHNVRVDGTVTVTNFRLYFEGSYKKHLCILDIPLGFIYRVEKVGHSSLSRSASDYGLNLHCKDLRVIQFSSTSQDHGRRKLAEALQRHSFPLSNSLPLFAFSFASALGLSPYPGAGYFPRDGWTLFDMRTEMKRLIDRARANDAWRITTINSDYAFADTYPAYFAVPRAAADDRDFLVKCGEHRSKQRIPALSWLHPVTQASITRCSQPMCGVRGKRSSQDEALLKMVRDVNAHSNTLLIFDARPLVNARVNRAKGGGFEEEYVDCELSFLNIQNIHSIRESLRKLQLALTVHPTDKLYLRHLDESKWLHHIQTICEGSVRIVVEVEQRSTSILVHCSDGWDRTAQLTALAELQLEPFYRTIEGFAVLVEKEWAAFGHKFAHRIGHGDDKSNDHERSPIFVQFIDCVWQVLRQFPTAFEFNSAFLVCILDELYACQYGTFLYNSEKQRHADNKCRSLTVSLWSHVLRKRSQFTNPLYKTRDDRLVIKMNPKLCFLRVWTEYYARHNHEIISPHAKAVFTAGMTRVDERKAILMELTRRLEQQNKTRESHSAHSIASYRYM